MIRPVIRPTFERKRKKNCIVKPCLCHLSAYMKIVETPERCQNTSHVGLGPPGFQARQVRPAGAYRPYGLGHRPQEPDPGPARAPAYPGQRLPFWAPFNAAFLLYPVDHVTMSYCVSSCKLIPAKSTLLYQSPLL